MALEITRKDARRQALGGLIDYAGLFPPAQLPMEAAVAEYREVRRGPSAWLVDRFVCPAGRLEELAGALIASLSPGESPWRLVVTATVDDAAAVAAFSAEMGSAVVVDAVELPLPAAAGSDAVVGWQAEFACPLFFEIAWGDDVDARCYTLAAARERSGRALGAKIRTGGVTPHAFPAPAAVAAFLLAAARHRIPLKATAGLHHPLRHTDPVTGFTHHGFLNLLTAASLAHEGADAETITAALQDTDASGFALEPAGLEWRGWRFGEEALAAIRRETLVGYGSCSIDEPVSDLVALGMLPVAS